MKKAAFLSIRSLGQLCCWSNGSGEASGVARPPMFDVNIKSTFEQPGPTPCAPARPARECDRLSARLHARLNPE